MKRLPIVIGSILLLVALVTGCGRAPRYDSRLAAADSLLRSDPDSALSIIQAVTPDSLATLGDRAYCDLLLTQTRYKCYITATSDSDINRALAYYQQHSREREKLTRAYIYKGAVMEELGHPDSAMLYYKQAEATAAPDDYFNLGYVKMMIGDLYTFHYAMDGKDIEKYEESLECFMQTDNTEYKFYSTNNLGCLYRETNPKRADSLLMMASEFAHEMNDKQHIATNVYSRIVLYFYQHHYDKARQLVHTVTDSTALGLGYNFLFTCANIYARCGKLDSAYYYCNLAQQNRQQDEQYSMYYLGCLSELALANNDSISYLKYSQQSQSIANVLKANEEKLHILNTETDFDKELAEQNKKKHEAHMWMMLSVLVFVTTVISFLYYRRKHRYDGLIKELLQERNEQKSNISQLEHHNRELIINDQSLKDFISAHTALMREVIEACYHEPRNRLAEHVRKIVKYQKVNKQMWTRFYDYIDLEYNGIMKHTIKEYPQLNEKEVLLIALTCMGYSYIETAIILGYDNATTISGNKQRVAKKMNLGHSLNDYIKSFQNNPDD